MLRLIAVPDWLNVLRSTTLTGRMSAVNLQTQSERLAARRAAAQFNNLFESNRFWGAVQIPLQFSGFSK